MRLISSRLLVTGCLMAVLVIACTKVPHSALRQAQDGVVPSTDIVDTTALDQFVEDAGDSAPDGDGSSDALDVDPFDGADLALDQTPPQDLDALDLAIPDDLSAEIEVSDIPSVEIIQPDVGPADVKDLSGDGGHDAADTGDLDAAPDIIVVECTGDGQCAQFNTQCSQGHCVGGKCQVQNFDGQKCDDGLFCTDGDTCIGGKCQGKVKSCAKPGDPCQESVCSEITKTCVAQSKKDGESCTSDNFSCTNQACFGGQCVLRDISGCFVLGACYQDGDASPQNSCQGCKPQTSQFNFSPLPDGSPCKTATGDGTCLNGSCSSWQKVTFPGAQFYAIDRQGPSQAVWVVGESENVGMIWQLKDATLSLAFKTTDVRFRGVWFDMAVGEPTQSTKTGVALFSGQWSVAPAALNSLPKSITWRAVLGGQSGNVRNYVITGDHDAVMHCFCAVNFGCLAYTCEPFPVQLGPNSKTLKFKGRAFHMLNPDADNFSLFVVGTDDDSSVFDDVALFLPDDNVFVVTGNPLAYSSVITTGDYRAMFGNRLDNLWVVGTGGLVLTRRPLSDGQVDWNTMTAVQLGLTGAANLTAGFADDQAVTIFGDRPTDDGGRELFVVRGEFGTNNQIKWSPPLAIEVIPSGLSPAAYDLLQANDIDFVPNVGFLVVGTAPDPQTGKPVGTIWIYKN